MTGLSSDAMNCKAKYKYMCVEEEKLVLLTNANKSNEVPGAPPIIASLGRATGSKTCWVADPRKQDKGSNTVTAGASVSLEM